MRGVDEVLAFLDTCRESAAREFTAIGVPKFLSFMGTTSEPGSRLEVASRRLEAIEPEGSTLRVRLAGGLPRAPRTGETVTVAVNHLRTMSGYQIKTFNLLAADQLPQIAESGGAGITNVHGRFVYTVLDGPNVQAPYQAIPFDQVSEVAGRVPFVLVGVGPQANISPRFVFHHAIENGHLVFYHGDGHAHKTLLNVTRNPVDTRVVVDIDTFRGFAFEGPLEPLDAGSHPKAWEKVRAGFAAGGWAPPKRAFRFVAERWTELKP